MNSLGGPLAISLTSTSPLQVRANFRPEFVNRIDEFIVFQALRKEEIKKIVRIQAARVEKRLAEKKIKMQLTESAVDFLAVSSCILFQDTGLFL